MSLVHWKSNENEPKTVAFRIKIYVFKVKAQKIQFIKIKIYLRDVLNFKNINIKLKKKSFINIKLKNKNI